MADGAGRHHFGARFTAAEHGLDHELAAFDDPAARPAGWPTLTTADQTTGPDGHPMDGDTRLADMLNRHGPDSPQARVSRSAGATVADREASIPS